MILGDFELRREIGRGGMGTVYEAWQRSLQRVVAVKVLERHVSATAKAVVRFQREAQAAAKLHHTHIVPIYAQAETDGVYYYAMEFIEGCGLNAIIADLRGTASPDASTVDLTETVALTPSREAVIRTRSASDGPPLLGDQDPALALGVRIMTAEDFNYIASHLADVADALDYAHQRGVIHRDIKPHNLLLGVDGRMRISDFGLARLAEQPGVTITGEVIGSPLYMSPEQISGNPENVDHRADIYSLGATMYEWLTLRPPYPGETRERVISMILSSEPAALRSLNAAVPLDLETICLKAVERNRERRYQTAAEMRDDLRRYLASRPIVAKRTGIALRAAKFVGRHQLTSLAAVAAVIALSLSWALHVKQQTVRQQTAVAVQAKESEDLVLDLISRLPLELRGPLRMAEAAVPMAKGMLQSEQAESIWGGANGADASASSVGTPAALARRAAGELYKTVALPNWPASPSAGEDEAATHLKEAVERSLAGHAEEALKLLDTYLEVKPDDFEARQLHTVLCGQVGRYDRMAGDADWLLALRGQAPNGFLWRGLALLLLDQVDRSLEDLSQASAMDRGSAWAKALRGLALVQLGRALEALPYFEEVLNGSPGSVVARLGRAMANAAVGRHQDAVADATEVIRVEPNNADALTIRGDCYLSLADFAAAASDFQRAMSIAGRTPALGIKYLSAVLQQRHFAEIKNAQPDAKGDPAADPDEGSSRGPLLDWFSRKVRPRTGGRGGNP
jgi:serine/threonine protein kinase/tetratricopeptide (TPR) repeat protein